MAGKATNSEVMNGYMADDAVVNCVVTNEYLDRWCRNERGCCRAR